MPKDEAIANYATVGWCYRHKNYARVRACLKHSINQKQGIAVITGASGTGKTFLVEQLIEQQFSELLQVARVNMACISTNNLIKEVCEAFKVKPGRPTKKTAGILQQHLHGIISQGLIPTLILENAHDSNTLALDLLCQLIGLEIPNGKPALLILLLGNPQLSTKLSAKHAQFFRQHSVGACHLEPFDQADTRVYIEALQTHMVSHKSLEIADSAYERIYQITQGIVGNINRLFSQLDLQARIRKLHSLVGDDVETIAASLREQGQLTEPDPDTQSNAQREGPGIKVNVPNKEAEHIIAKPAIKSAIKSQTKPDRNTLTSVVRMNQSHNKYSQVLSERRKEMYGALSQEATKSLKQTKTPAVHQDRHEPVRTKRGVGEIESKVVTKKIHIVPEPSDSGVQTTSRVIAVDAPLPDLSAVKRSADAVPAMYAHRDGNVPSPTAQESFDKSSISKARIDWQFILLLTTLLIVLGVLLLRVFSANGYVVWLENNLLPTELPSLLKSILNL